MSSSQYTNTKNLFLCEAESEPRRRWLVTLATNLNFKRDEIHSSEALIKSDEIFYRFFFLDDTMGRGFGFGGAIQPDSRVFKIISYQEMISYMISGTGSMEQEPFDFKLNINKSSKY